MYSLSEFISTDWLSFQSLWSLCRCLLCRRDVPVCISSLFFLYSVTIHCYSLVWWNLKPESAIPWLSWLCMSPIPGTITGSCTIWSRSSTLYSFAEYLVLDDGGCLNALLLADFIPSNSDHLLWDRNLESFLSALRLAVISGRFSHHRQFWEYINVPWSMDFSKFSNSTHQFTLVRLHSVHWFPFSLSVGDLASVNGIH